MLKETKINMTTLTHKEVCSKGGKNSWKGKSKKERYEIIKARWAKGREKKATNKD